MKVYIRKYQEVIILGLIVIASYFVLTLNVNNVLTIWNQNDEFGVWQGAAWILGLDWSEISSANGFYGQGYGILLAPIMKIWGNDVVIMTQMAVRFQALLHSVSIFIAWYCVSKMAPQLKAYQKIIAATIPLLSIPEIYYIYYFFSESILRFLVWVYFAFVVSFYSKKKSYKVLGLVLVSFYAFSIHQRCILLLGVTLLIIGEEILHIGRDNRKVLVYVIPIVFFMVVLSYFVIYKFPQNMYMANMYSLKAEGGDSNLLSNRGYTLSYIVSVVFNKAIFTRVIHLISGLIYYTCSFDCGLTILGVFLCVKKSKFFLKNRDEINKVYIVAGLLFIGAILLNAYQIGTWYDYQRIDMLMYGRYVSYVYAPLLLIGIINIFESDFNKLRMETILTIGVLLVSGNITFNVIRNHDMSTLFAFHNSCVGILSKYYTEDPVVATAYHILIGVLWIVIPFLCICFSRRIRKRAHQASVIAVFICIAVVWICVAYKEVDYTNEMKSKQVRDTYDLMCVLNNENEFIAYKSYSHGDGLLQYNYPYSKIYKYDSLSEFDELKIGMLVVSQKNIEEMSNIYANYQVEYENDTYFVWRYDVLDK